MTKAILLLLLDDEDEAFEDYLTFYDWISK